jgi:hypothetical protein
MGQFVTDQERRIRFGQLATGEMYVVPSGHRPCAQALGDAVALMKLH